MPWNRRSLRRAARRRAPVAFWHFGQAHLAVATLRAGDEEPLLLACAAVRAKWVGPTPVVGRMLCPGFLELVSQGVAGARLHAAAVAIDDGPAENEETIELEEAGRCFHISRSRIDHVVRLFAAARLHLVALDLDAAADDRLARHFGPANSRPVGQRGLADDPLAAVSVTPACEEAAAALGNLLAVPVGLALASFGASEDP